MAIAKCNFCGKEQEDFKGVYLAKNDGTTMYFCSSKCRKNTFNLKRDKRKVRWAEAFHLARAKKSEREKKKIFEKSAN